MSSQTVIVAGTGYRDPQQVLMSVDCPQHSRKEEEEDHILMGAVSRIQQVLPVTGCDGPVEMLATAIQPLKRLLMHQTLQPVVARHPLERQHHQLLMIGCDIAALKDRCNFKLAGSHLVVARLDGDTQSVELPL